MSGINDKIANLARARKEKMRQEARAKADANAAKFGRTKAERVLDASRAEQARSKLDQHRRQRPPEQDYDSE